MKNFATRCCVLFAALAIVILLLAPESVGQMGGGHRRGQMTGRPFYNTATETTVTGTVHEVQQIAATGGNGNTWIGPHSWTGTHLMLKTDTGILPVHVGPSSFLASKNFSISKGDKLTILGSKVQHEGSDFLIAREITKETQVLRLRNSQGFPMWTGFRMGSTPLPSPPAGK